MASLVKHAANKFYNQEYEEALSLYKQVQEAYPEISRLFEVNVALCERERSGESLAVTLTRRCNVFAHGEESGGDSALFDAQFWQVQAKQLLDELEFMRKRQIR